MQQPSSALLLTEANLSAGAESCAAVDEVTLVSHALLAGADFEGDRVTRVLTEREVTLVAELTDVLASYNTGELCR